jgi:DNA-binding SARP family transcriptional activator
MIELRLLGPLEAPVALPSGKPRALLARLLLDADRVVAADALVDALWGDEAPPSAPKVLQAHVSALRKALGAEVIETRAPGYALRGSSSDVARFEELTDRARAVDGRERIRLLREALALWRGEPLAEFRREPFARLAAARLAELRLDALGRLFDAELDAGEHASLVPELVALLEEVPLREQPRRQLMLSLYRSGRQAEALAVYRDGRRLLVDELGIEPSLQLQALERRILRQDPALAAAPEAPARGPIVCVAVASLALFTPLARELIAVELAADAAELSAATQRLESLRTAKPAVRTAAFTTTDPAADLARFATEQQAELLVLSHLPDGLLDIAPCDVALANAIPDSGEGPVVAPFGGGQDEWAALEVATWLAQAHGVPLRLLGTDAAAGERDASRLLASASLSLQRFTRVSVEPSLVRAGADGVLEHAGRAIVASLPRGPLDATRQALLDRARVPVLLVHGGLRPSGLAPDRTLTRYRWSLVQ